LHEYSIVQALYDNVMSHARAQGAKSVEQVHVRIGAISGVEVGLLDTAWRTFRVHTPCEHADMHVEVVPACWECPRCRASAARSGMLRCASCGGPLRLTRGDEIVLDQIVMEV